jgi:hypothetical protein
VDRRHATIDGKLDVSALDDMPEPILVNIPVASPSPPDMPDTPLEVDTTASSNKLSPMLDDAAFATVRRNWGWSAICEFEEVREWARNPGGM